MDMDTTDIRNFAASVKKLTVGARASGPRTEAGRARSSINAVRHGLTGRGLLLPGETAAEYEAKLDGIFTSLAPRDDAEAELVALAADDIWKLSRLARIEKGITLGRIEELLAFTGTAEKVGSTVNAIHALGAALASWTDEPLPAEKGTEFRRRFGAMASAIGLVEATVASPPAGYLGVCNELLDRLHGRQEELGVDQAAYLGLFDAAREVMTVLLDRGHAEEAALEELRACIAGIALPTKEELAKLAKYRAMLETSLQRRLAALEQLRKITVNTNVTEAAVDKSKEYRVKLRVVV